MVKISLQKFGPTITNIYVADKVFDIIINSKVREEQIKLDLEGIITMTTQCAKRIFGHLYKELGSDIYYQNIVFENRSETLEMIIEMSIEEMNNS